MPSKGFSAFCREAGALLQQKLRDLPVSTRIAADSRL